MGRGALKAESYSISWPMNGYVQPEPDYAPLAVVGHMYCRLRYTSHFDTRLFT